MAQLSAPIVDLSGLAKKSDLPDLTSYAKKTDLPDVTPYALKTDVASIITLKYVNGGNTQTLAQLLTNYPPALAYLNYYARVSDLYGSVDDILRCRNDGTGYKWVPQRESYNGTTAVSGGTINVIPLVTPPTLRLTTTGLTSNITIQASSLNAYIGQKARVIMPPTLTVSGYITQITGLIGSNITLLAGNTKDIEYGSTGWFQSS